MRAARLTPAAILAAALPAFASQRAVYVPPAAAPVATACAAPASDACTTALEALARKAADDLTLVANSGLPEVRPMAREAARMPFASLRASGAAALARLSPGPEDTPLLTGLLNDAVPAVRRGAQRALDSSADPAARSLVQRATSQAGGTKPDAPPDAERLKVPVYPGAQYLFFASRPADGLSEFSTADAYDKVAAFYAGKYGAGQTPEEFEAAAKKGKDSFPDFNSPAYRDQIQAAQDAQKAYQEALKAGKSQQEAAMAMQAAMAGRQPANPSRIHDAMRKKEIYGSPKLFTAEKGMQPGQPARAVAVYKDLLLGKTGIAIFTGPLAERR